MGLNPFFRSFLVRKILIDTNCPIAIFFDFIYSIISMLTNDDISKLQKVILRPIEERFDSLERKIDSVDDRLGSVDDRLGSVEKKVDKLTGDVTYLKIETKAIHHLIETQDKDFRERIEKLEEYTGITP